ncbi:MAG: hemagglutinin repeat-containing protein [Alphaproteobacteria bacterium]|nr:hemagglutinin repeat-containing protein [Alphaproteobacteria bacterium]
MTSIYNASSGFTDPSKLLPSISLTLGISTSSSKYQTSGSNYTQTNITAGHDFISHSGKDTNVKGANILAQNVNMDVGQNLTVKSVQDTQETSQSSHSGGLSVGISYGVTGMSGTFGANASASSGEGHRTWTDHVTSIIGTDSVAINTDGKTTLTGALIAQATPQEDGTYIDGGNLTINTGSLAVSDLTDEDIWNSSGAGIAVGFGGQVGQPVFGSGSNLSSSYTPSLQIAQDTTIGVTHATIGSGTIYIGNQTASDVQLKGVNRDINKTQEILVDEHDHLDIEVPLDGWKNIKAAAEDIKNKLDKIFSGDINNDYEQYLHDQKEKYADAYGEDNAEKGVALGNQLIASVQSGGCPVAFNLESFHLRNLFISEAYADEAVMASLSLCLAGIAAPEIVVAIGIGVALGALGAALWNGLDRAQKALLYKYGYVYKDGELKDKTGKVIFSTGGATAAAGSPKCDPDDCDLNDPKYDKDGNLFGSNGQKLDGSKSFYLKSGERIDIENFEPGKKPGQIHTEYEGTKYIYNINTEEWASQSGDLLNKTTTNILNNSNALAKALKYMGY